MSFNYRGKFTGYLRYYKTMQSIKGEENGKKSVNKKIVYGPRVVRMGELYNIFSQFSMPKQEVYKAVLSRIQKEFPNAKVKGKDDIERLEEYLEYINKNKNIKNTKDADGR